ncbi:tyrosine-type recombinase/integrase [Serratia marcescens]|nr:tyrosine-type recombinase/integrase [Serratia marcescens]MBH3063797.1 tyrosine-type recombinase/integrase [Serratia marcescens]
MTRRLYLTYREVQQIYQAIGGKRNCIRDRCMILMCFIHGLRTSELTGLKITDIDFLSGCVYIRRLKNGFSTTHPLHPREISLLKAWLNLRTAYDIYHNEWLFLSAKGQRMTRQQFYKILSSNAKLAGLAVKAHPHMLRHACGYELAEQGLDTRLIQDYLGHRNIRHTVHYTASNAARFACAWQTATVPPPEEEVNRVTFFSW